MKPASCCRVSPRKTGAVSEMKSFQNCPGCSGAGGDGASRSAMAQGMTKIAVTGGSGKAGRVVVRHLFAQGHEVLNIDQVGSPESNHPEDPIPFLRADLTDFGQALEALSGGDT